MWCSGTPAQGAVRAESQLPAQLDLWRKGLWLQTSLGGSGTSENSTWGLKVCPVGGAATHNPLGFFREVMPPGCHVLGVIPFPGERQVFTAVLGLGKQFLKWLFRAKPERHSLHAPGVAR